MQELVGDPPPAAGGKRLLAIDGLRGVAIGSVVLYHLWPGITRPLVLTIVPQSGNLGVDLSFFISGFAIFYPYARTIVDGRERQTRRTFFLRRFAKIVPSYALSIALMLLFGWAVAIPGTSLLTQLFTHALFIHNWFANTSPGINGVLWSLGIEIQFYLFFAATLPLALRAPLRYAAGLVGIALAYHLWVALALHRHRGLVLDQLPGNLDFFASGILCAYFYRYVAARKPDLAKNVRGWTALGIAGSILGYCWLFVIRPTDPTGSNVGDALIHVVSPAIFLACGLGTLFATQSWTRVVANPVTLFLMDISYNLYLWHQILYLTLRRYFGGEHPSRLSAIVLACAGVACSILVATILTKCFEHPVQRRFRSLETRLRLRPRERVLLASRTAGRDE